MQRLLLFLLLVKWMLPVYTFSVVTTNHNNHHQPFPTIKYHHRYETGIIGFQIITTHSQENGAPAVVLPRSSTTTTTTPSPNRTLCFEVTNGYEGAWRVSPDIDGEELKRFVAGNNELVTKIVVKAKSAFQASAIVARSVQGGDIGMLEIVSSGPNTSLKSIVKDTFDVGGIVYDSPGPMQFQAGDTIMTLHVSVLHADQVMHMGSGSP